MPDTANLPFHTIQEERTAGVRVYRPHTTQPPQFSIDWAALTPACRSCGTKSGQLNRDDQCTTCAAPEPPQQEAPTGKPTTRRSAPRANRPSRSPAGLGSDGASAARKKRPARRETRPVRAGRPGRPQIQLDTDAILEAYAGGQSLVSIAEALDCTVPPIRRVLVDAGVTIRGNQYAGQPGAPVDEQAVLAEYLAGDTAPAVAERHGIRPKRVRTIVERHGADLRDDRAGHSGGKPRDYDPEICAAVERLYVVEQLSRAQVAEQLNIPYKSVVTIMARRGVRARTGQAGHTDGASALKARIRDLGVDSTEIKGWAFRRGLIDRIAPGIPSATLVEEYAAAHKEAGAA